MFFVAGASIWLAACGQSASQAETDTAQGTSTVHSSSNKLPAKVVKENAVDHEYAARLRAGAVAAAAKENPVPAEQ